MNVAKTRVMIEQLLASADIKINGNNAWDIQINDERFYSAVLTNPVLGIGESYIQNWWECERLDQFFYQLLRANFEEKLTHNKKFLYNFLRTRLIAYFIKFINLQSKKRAFQVGRHHYDIGNDFYQHMLDPNMNYSCGYWKNVNTLEAAQNAKLELVCQKLALEPGMKVLDIGCGWGGFSKYAAEKYKVSVIGITISKQQQSYAQAKCRDLPVEIRLQDYRELNETVDRICSIGMFEHVGNKNYKTYMEIAHRCLKADGLFLLHTIGNNFSNVKPNEWIHKYIFPNGSLPSIAQISTAIEKLFVMEDWHNFGADYDKTLMAWQHNFMQHWKKFKAQYDPEFYRMWNYYLLSCAGAFRARDIQLWQIVLSKQGILGGYQSIR